MKEHKLKIRSDYLFNIIARKKTSDVRFNDRDFQPGDEVLLYEIEADGQMAKFPVASYKISHIHSGLGMLGNYVVLSFKKVEILI